MRTHKKYLCALSLFATLIAGLLAFGVNGCVPPGTPLGSLGGRPVDSLGNPLSVTRVVNMRIHGAEDQSAPPFLRIATDGGSAKGYGSDALTLKFDMLSPSSPSIMLNLVHCDRNWVPTENIFVQDPVRLRSDVFSIVRTAAGISSYDYEVSITFPGSDSRIRIEHSGNYLAQIVDYYNRDTVLAETRFYVNDGTAGVSISGTAEFYSSAQTDVVQQGLRLRVEIDPSFEIFGSNIKAIALVESGDWYDPIVASGDAFAGAGVAGSAWTRWYPSFAGRAVAEFGNLPAGNEHRILNLTDVLSYPTIGGVISTPLSDQPRRGFAEYDNNGIPRWFVVSLGDADYVLFEFRLDLAGREVQEDIFVVGTFNNWRVLPEWRMNYDSSTGFYTAQGWLPRAVHEYEYLSGTWDPVANVLVDADASLIEGNDRLSTTLYYAIAYYHEPSVGGYDRIIGIGSALTGSR